MFWVYCLILTDCTFTIVLLLVDCKMLTDCPFTIVLLLVDCKMQQEVLVLVDNVCACWCTLI